MIQRRSPFSSLAAVTLCGLGAAQPSCASDPCSGASGPCLDLAVVGSGSYARLAVEAEYESAQPSRKTIAAAGAATLPYQLLVTPQAQDVGDAVRGIWVSAFDGDDILQAQGRAPLRWTEPEHLRLSIPVSEVPRGPLALTGVQPSAASPAGGIPLVLSGRRFSARATVRIAGLPAPPVADPDPAASSAEQLRVLLPRSPGTLGPVPIEISNPSGERIVVSDAFSYLPQPADFTTRWVPLAADAGAIGQADFNGDGKLDLAVGYSVLLGDGAGNFAVATSSGSATPLLAIADFNSDGKPDVASAALRLGDGAGGLSASLSYDSSPTMYGAPTGVATGDLNLDGKPDLVVTRVGSSHVISLFLGDGTGRFSRTDLLNQGNGLSALLQDVNGDGKPDLVVPYHNTGLLTVSLGDGSGGLSAPRQSTTTSTAFTSLVAVDWNGDGKLDVITVGPYGSVLMQGDGTGSFTLRGRLPAGKNPRSVVAGDFNLDGRPDVAVADAESGEVRILFNDGTGLGSHPLAVAAGANAASLTAGDYDGDGRLDLAVSADKGVRIVLNRL